jgi:CRISPR-associated endonuclease/helicase Cas3
MEVVDPFGDRLTFAQLVRQAAGHDPYPYQQRLADQGLPELLKAPTGAGKTLAATLPWLYRRRFHPDAAIRATTPHWLVLVLPMRVLVEQTLGEMRGWLDRLDLSEAVGLNVLMGGEPVDSTWRLDPGRDAIFVGTLDMVLSRALNRGYGESRWAWPINFGLLNNGCHYVFDEVQLMGPALPTSRQLQAIRQRLGTALACSSTWMSATVDPRQLFTVDRPEVTTTVALDESDRRGPLARRLDATKTVHRLDVDHRRYARDLATELVRRHRAGTRTLAICNTVDRATELHAALASSAAADTVLVHSRFRPADRAERVGAALGAVDSAGPGTIVVSTQVLEAGVDISSTTLFTEAALWPSIVQRAGRCNRGGREPEAVLLWCDPPKALPYDGDALARSAEALSTMEGAAVTPVTLGAVDVAVAEPVHAVLRRRDLVELFDTTPDLSGNDVDVARFIRQNDDLDASVAWQDLPDDGPEATAPLPGRDERCPVPVAALREAVEGRDAWRYDHIEEAWVRCRRNDVRPGLVILLRGRQGGYDPRLGWTPTLKTPVEPVVPSSPPSPLTEADTATSADPLTFAPRRWMGLRQHLSEAEHEVRLLSTDLAPTGLAAEHLEAAAVAARLHDIGKAHEAFQDMLRQSAGDSASELANASACGPPWAKSSRRVTARNRRPHFRHELASALSLLGEGSEALEGVSEPDLVVYLVAAHHGRVRLGVRSLPDERSPPDDPDRGVVLGIWDHDVLPKVDVPGGTVPASTLDLSLLAMGNDDRGRASWSRRMLTLRDRPDLGPFRLGFLEALVRMGDWRASAAADTDTDTDTEGALR